MGRTKGSTNAKGKKPESKKADKAKEKEKDKKKKPGKQTALEPGFTTGYSRRADAPFPPQAEGTDDDGATTYPDPPIEVIPAAEPEQHEAPIEIASETPPVTEPEPATEDSPAQPDESDVDAEPEIEIISAMPQMPPPATADPSTDELQMLAGSVQNTIGKHFRKCSLAEIAELVHRSHPDVEVSYDGTTVTLKDGGNEASFTY